LTVPRVAVIVAVLAATGVGIVYFAKALSRLDGQATANSRLSFADRDIAGGNSIIVDQQAAYEARSLIPVTSTYRVVTGSLLKNATPLTAGFVVNWFTYFLMPRRPQANATWIICYGCDATKLHGRYRSFWHDENNISIGRIG
jgi:hypothetical protein